MGPTRRRVTVLEMASVFTWAEAAALVDPEETVEEGRDSTIVPTFDITISHWTMLFVQGRQRSEYTHGTKSYDQQHEENPKVRVSN